MAARTDPLAHHSFPYGRRRHPKASDLEPETASSSRGVAAARGALSALLQVQPVSLSILIVVLGISLWLGYGFVMGKISPEVMVTVQQFEVPPQVANRLLLSGKSASDITQDVINDVLAGADQFSGNAYYKYENGATHLLAASKSVKTPVETSYGIELKGISLDNIMHLYNSGRYQQWAISGDILSTPHGMVGRVRSSLRDKAGFWQTPPSNEDNPAVLIQEATYMMLASIDPELLGRACLQRGDYEHAVKVFRQWEMDDPRNWRPTYYLSLAYSSQQGMEDEANIFADWSREIKDHSDKQVARKVSLKSQSNEKIALSLQTTAQLALRTKLDLDALPQASPALLSEQLAALKSARGDLQVLVKTEPDMLDYKFEEARTVAKLALVQSYDNPGSSDAKDTIDQAIEEFALAAKYLPDNGGFHQQLAVFSAYKVEIMERHKDSRNDIDAAVRDEIKEYKIALRMRPSETPPLWGAIYADLKLGDRKDAIDLSRKMILLTPDSQDARVAFILAAERGDKSQRIIKEEDLYLQQVLSSKAEENKLDVLWCAFRDSKNQEDLELVAAQGRQRFPKNVKFKTSFKSATEPKPVQSLISVRTAKPTPGIAAASSGY